jgi:phage repressor protein C with HTH and peptisase S24 domain
MLPTLHQGEIVVAIKTKQVTGGDVVIAKLDNREVIKRVIGINNGAYYLVGDNSEQSTDSRTKGTVTRADILGRVVWPRISR